MPANNYLRANLTQTIPFEDKAYSLVLFFRFLQRNSLMFLIGLLKEMKLAAPERIKERYQESVNQLAKIDPLLAYQLSGRPQTDFNETVDDFIEKATELEGEKAKLPSAANAVPYFGNFIKGYGQGRVLSTMETDIIAVARTISYLTAHRSRRALQQLTVRLAEEAETYIDQFLDSLVMHVATQGPISQGTVDKPTSESVP